MVVMWVVGGVVRILNEAVVEFCGLVELCGSFVGLFFVFGVQDEPLISLQQIGFN